MEYIEDKMVTIFVERCKNSKDIATEKRIALMFIKQNGLSVFRFINRLRKRDEKLCEKFVKELEGDKIKETHYVKPKECSS